MIRISNIKIPIESISTQTKEEQMKAVKHFCQRKYKMRDEEIKEIILVKRSLDARKRDNLHYTYCADLSVAKENRFLKNPDIVKRPKDTYVYPTAGKEDLKNRPVIIGMGPAGLFCALELAKAGYHPLVIERGEAVEKRVVSVENFWSKSPLKKDSNVVFGEGGAGTFSDGKLNTLVKDTFGRHRRVLNTFLTYGAPEEIGYINKPHIGTDRLRDIVKNMREEIIHFGGEVRFEQKLTDIIIDNGKLNGIVINNTETLPCEVLILAIGHSARDTFSLLKEKGLLMEPKAFAVGLRAEHPQEIIGASQYGSAYDKLPAADYKVTYKTKNERSVYSFCMCPGGFVVNASSEEGHLCVNGMSNYNRDEVNANSALIVTVTPKDFPSGDVLAGVEFQRQWERRAFKEGKGKIPVQRYEDFKENRQTKVLGSITPNTKGGYHLSNLRNCLPEYITESLVEAIEAFGGKIKGFADGDTILSGVETRTSSPVRIVRNQESLQGNITGIYPCGEGAGYAGGIVSAAMDGIRIFEKVVSVYQPFNQFAVNKDNSINGT